MNTAEDLYPSRRAAEERVIERMDPVVWSDPRKPAPIDRELINRYERDGFLILENVFDEQELDCFKEELDRLRSDSLIGAREETVTEPDSGAVRSIFAVHKLSPIFRRLAEDERIAGLAEHILDDEVYIHQSRVNYKPGFRGAGFNWHSDFETWHVEDGIPRMRALSASILLTDNTEYNGPLMLIPGSHTQYLTCVGETPEDHYKQSLKKQEFGVPSEQALQRLYDRGGIVTSRARAGSVILFDCNTMHGSNSNISPLPRSNVFFVYNAMSNRVQAPFCNRRPRPEYISARQHVEPCRAVKRSVEDYRSNA